MCNELCVICGERAGELRAPQGWDAESNSPAWGWQCWECAVQDGWVYLNEELGTVLGVPYEEWRPTRRLVDELAAEERKRAG